MRSEVINFINERNIDNVSIKSSVIQSSYRGLNK